MSEKTIIRKIIADWKQQDSEADKNVFLEKVKTEINAKNGAEIMGGVKAISELVHDLHDEVMQPAPAAKPIEVFPNDAEEAHLIEM
ncbi:MAG TPA: hypothetical protein ENJ95_23700 [Bacteroidetes bacterium]|nr:hypothetical protein [Bacteroidota bacterium]